MHVGTVVVLISFGHQLNVYLVFNEFAVAYNAWLLGKLSGGWGTSVLVGPEGWVCGLLWSWQWGTPERHWELPEFAGSHCDFLI